jgi:hypothetical protein
LVGTNETEKSNPIIGNINPIKDIETLKEISLTSEELQEFEIYLHSLLDRINLDKNFKIEFYHQESSTVAKARK